MCQWLILCFLFLQQEKPRLPEPLDYETIIEELEKTYQNDPLRDLLFFPSDDFSVSVLLSSRLSSGWPARWLGGQGSPALHVVTLHYSHCSGSPHPAISSAQEPRTFGRWGLSDSGHLEREQHRALPGSSLSCISANVWVSNHCPTWPTSSCRPFLTKSFQATVINWWQRWDSLGTKEAILKSHS